MIVEDSWSEEIEMDPQDLLFYVSEALKAMGIEHRISTEPAATPVGPILVRLVTTDRFRVAIYGSGKECRIEVGPISGQKELIEQFIVELVSRMPKKPWNFLSKRRWIKAWPKLKELG